MERGEGEVLGLALSLALVPKFTEEALSHTVDGLTISDIEHLTIAEELRDADGPTLTGVIDLGPGPGRHGGTVLHAGPVNELPDTATGRALRQDVVPRRTW